MTLCYEDYLELIGEQVVIIEYQTNNQHAIGRMLMCESFYNKKYNKLKRVLKDCEIYHLYQGKLTHEILMDYLGKEFKR